MPTLDEYLSAFVKHFSIMLPLPEALGPDSISLQPLRLSAERRNDINTTLTLIGDRTKKARQLADQNTSRLAEYLENFREAGAELKWLEYRETLVQDYKALAETYKNAKTFLPESLESEMETRRDAVAKCASSLGTLNNPGLASHDPLVEGLTFDPVRGQVPRGMSQQEILSIVASVISNSPSDQGVRGFDMSEPTRGFLPTPFPQDPVVAAEIFFPPKRPLRTTAGGNGGSSQQQTEERRQMTQQSEKTRTLFKVELEAIPDVKRDFSCDAFMVATASSNWAQLKRSATAWIHTKPPVYDRLLVALQALEQEQGRYVGIKEEHSTRLEEYLTSHFGMQGRNAELDGKWQKYRTNVVQGYFNDVLTAYRTVVIALDAYIEAKQADTTRPVQVFKDQSEKFTAEKKQLKDDLSKWRCDMTLGRLEKELAMGRLRLAPARIGASPLQTSGPPEGPDAPRRYRSR